jgi:hypothetical protein
MFLNNKKFSALPKQTKNLCAHFEHGAQSLSIGLEKWVLGLEKKAAA